MKQLVHVVGPLLCSPFFEPPGLAGRDGTALFKPDSGGVLGDVCEVLAFMLCRSSCAVLGVDVVRAIFCRRGSCSRLRTSLTEAADPCVRPRLPL